MYIFRKKKKFPSTFGMFDKKPKKGQLQTKTFETEMKLSVNFQKKGKIIF